MVGEADETIRWIVSNDERPELKRRAGEGAGRRMRREDRSANVPERYPPLSLRDISPSRGEIGTSWSINGSLSGIDCLGTIDGRRRSPKGGMLDE
jgi:hypothetical protein